MFTQKVLKGIGISLLLPFIFACSGDSENGDITIGKATEKVEREPIERRVAVEGADTSATASQGPQQALPDIEPLEDLTPRLPPSASQELANEPMPQETLGNPTPGARTTASTDGPARDPIELPEN